ncbi:MAG: tetratricopeptide repeat protein, partial [SAR202 cluster bacterium]
MAKNQSRLPDRSEFYYSLGIAYAASGKSENAIECYDEAVRNKPR